MRRLGFFCFGILWGLSTSYSMSTLILATSKWKLKCSETDNIYSPWSLEDDKNLYSLHLKGVPLADICVELGRGPVGVTSRIKNILNPDHKSFLRLFRGTEDPLKSGPLRPCKEVIERMLWDPTLLLVDFSFGHSDR